jgi:hypothetical protein
MIAMLGSHSDTVTPERSGTLTSPLLRTSRLKQCNVTVTGGTGAIDFLISYLVMVTTELMSIACPTSLKFSASLKT